MYETAKEKLINFIKENFDIENKKIKHKLSHTFYVVENAEYIADALKLSKEDKEIAQLTALLHDFGRFYEARDLQSFREDLNKMDHAALGVQLLFEDNMIREFIKEDKYDKILEKAIANHSKYLLDSTDMTDQELLHAQIIRDADKLDSFRAKSIEDIYTMSNITEEEIISSSVSKNIYNDFLEEKTILSKDRKTGLDIWVSYIAFVFGLYFDVSLKYLKDKDYVNILFDKFTYQSDLAQKQMQELKNKANEYLNKKIENII